MSPAGPVLHTHRGFLLPYGPDRSLRTVLHRYTSPLRWASGTSFRIPEAPADPVVRDTLPAHGFCHPFPPYKSLSPPWPELSASHMYRSSRICHRSLFRCIYYSPVPAGWQSPLHPSGPLPGCSVQNDPPRTIPHCGMRIHTLCHYP